MVPVFKSCRLPNSSIAVNPRNCPAIANYRPAHWNVTRNMATMPQQPAMKKRAVAGTFLFRYPKDEPSKAEVALFRRSGKVRTYQ